MKSIMKRDAATGLLSAENTQRSATQLEAEPTGLSRVALRLKRKIIRTLFHEQWVLLYGFFDGLPNSSSALKQIIPPRDRFWADPHVIHHGEGYYIFFEELLFAEQKGFLSVMPMDAAGNLGVPRKILERPYHLSYPHVFQWRGRYYMIPETIAAGAIELYECTDFPYQWRFCKTLIGDIWAVDTTLLYHQGKWWLFTNVAESADGWPNVNLFLYSSDDPLSANWRPHPKNPIVSAEKNSRPAGKLYEHKGILYRPAQDCRCRAGQGIRINRIITLSDSDYEEKEVDTIGPQPASNLIRVHTYNHEGGLTVMDGLRRKFKFL